MSVMKYHWEIGSRHVEMTYWSHIQELKCSRRFFLHISTVEMSGANNPVIATTMTISTTLVFYLYMDIWKIKNVCMWHHPRRTEPNEKLWIMQEQL
jgi:hypothetical protein